MLQDPFVFRVSYITVKGDGIKSISVVAYDVRAACSIATDTIQRYTNITRLVGCERGEEIKAFCGGDGGGVYRSNDGSGIV